MIEELVGCMNYPRTGRVLGEERRARHGMEKVEEKSVGFEGAVEGCV